MHGFGGQQHREFQEQFPFGAYCAQIKFAAALDHVVKHGIEGELIFSRPLGDQFLHPGAVAPNERRCRFRAIVLRVVREQAPQIAIVGFGRIDEIERALFLIIFAECLG